MQKILYCALVFLQATWTWSLQAESSKWESEVSAFEQAARTNPPPQKANLFAGSSSIRLWKSLASDFPDKKVINRGFGGSQIVDSTALADRLIFPYHPVKILLYAGDNDIAGGKSPETILADFQAFVQKVRSQLPNTEIAFISIKPSLSRWSLAEKVKQANGLVSDYVKKRQGLSYIDVFNPMLGTDGKPLPEIFISDNLHMNAKGYALWKQIIAPHLK